MVLQNDLTRKLRDSVMQLELRPYMDNQFLAKKHRQRGTVKEVEVLLEAHGPFRVPALRSRNS